MSLVMEETMSKLETARILATGAFLERTSISGGNLYDETHLIYKLYKYFFPEDELGQAASYLTYLGDEESVLERLVDLLGTELVEVLKIANVEASGMEEEFYTQLLSSKNLTALRVVFVHYVFVSKLCSFCNKFFCCKLRCYSFYCRTYFWSDDTFFKII